MTYSSLLWNCDYHSQALKYVYDSVWVESLYCLIFICIETSQLLTFKISFIDNVQDNFRFVNAGLKSLVLILHINEHHRLSTFKYERFWNRKIPISTYLRGTHRYHFTGMMYSYYMQVTDKSFTVAHFSDEPLYLLIAAVMHHL